MRRVFLLSPQGSEAKEKHVGEAEKAGGDVDSTWGRRAREFDLAYRNAINEVLRDEYIDDVQRALRKWNRTLEKMELETRITLPSRRFHRHQGIYSNHAFDPEGNLITEEELKKNSDRWLLNDEDNDYLVSIMHQVIEPGKMANWIAPPARGINGQPLDFEYVRL